MVRTLSSRKSYDDLDEAALGSSAAGDSPPASPPPLPQGWKVLETRPLTKLEQDAMDKAKVRDRAAAKSRMGANEAMTRGAVMRGTVLCRL